MPKHSKYTCTTNGHYESLDEYVCKLCEFTSNSETAVKLHLKFVHKITGKQANRGCYVCDICDRLFVTDKKLDTHFREKHGVRVKANKLR